MPLGPGTMAGIAEGIADVDRQLLLSPLARAVTKNN